MKVVLAWLFSLAAAAQGVAGTLTGKVSSRANDQSNAVVYAERNPPERVVPPKEPLVLDQVNLTFVPHVLPVVVGTKVAFPNSDQVRHNVFSPSPAKRFNLGTYPRGLTRTVTFDKPGEVVLLCNVHAEMSAYVLVLGTDHFVVPGKDGGYALKNLPPGKYNVTVWHEKFKSVIQAVEIKDNETVTLNFELKGRK